jgi:hypothetical protein
MKKTPSSQCVEECRGTRSCFVPPLSVFFVITLLFYASFTALPQFHASPGGTGDGSAENPAGLQHALDIAKAAGLQGGSVSINLAPGTYNSAPGGFVLTLAKNESLILSIYGAGDYNEHGEFVPSTMLDGGGANHILRFMANSTNSSLVLYMNYIKFQNGLAKDDGNAKTWDHGGAISAYVGTVDSSGFISMSVADCVFENNKTSGVINGGAVATNCSANFSKCIFESNDAANGGAIIAYDSPNGNYATPFLIEFCKFYDNTNNSNQGSSIWHNLNMTIKNSEFYGRTDGVSSSGPGSCVWGNQSSTSQISQCLFKNITIKYWGSAFQTFGGNAYIYDCLFINNRAGVQGSGYGAIAFYHDFKPVTTKRIVNCTFFNNSSAVGFGGALHNRGLSGDDVLVSNCILWNNGNYPIYSESSAANATISNSCIEGGLTNTNFADLGGNITTDPLFADDMCRLQKLSPCVNTGITESHPYPYSDLDGRLRIRSLIIDMGCFEYDSPPEAIELSPASVDEHTEGATSIYFSVLDDDPEDASLYSIELAEGDGTNDADNHLFGISYNQLYSTFTFDYEEKSVFNIFVKAKHTTETPGITQALVITVNDLNDPVIYNTGVVIEDQGITAGSLLNFTFPDNLFYDQDGNDTLIYTAAKGDGTPLPAWLSFNAAARTFSGTPLNEDEGILSVRITATDSHGSSANYTFNIIVALNTGMVERENPLFTVYPNPANEYLVIRFPNKTMEDHTLFLYDLQGKLIRLYENINTESFAFGLESIEAGVYLLKLEGRRVYRKRVVVKD